MSKAIFSRTKLCPEVANAAVANLIKIFVLPWAWLILFPAHIGMWRSRDERRSNACMDSRKKAHVSLVLELVAAVVKS